MKFKRKCVCHPNRKVDGKYRQRTFCSDCLKEMRRSKGTKNKKPTAVWSERYVFSIFGERIYQDYLVKLK